VLPMNSSSCELLLTPAEEQLPISQLSRTVSCAYPLSVTYVW